MFSKLKQFKDLRDKAKNLQTLLAGEVVEGFGAWSKIKVTMDGTQHVQKIEVTDELINLEQKKKLEAGLTEATNDAVKKVQRKVMEKMKGQPGFEMPGLS